VRCFRDIEGQAGKSTEGPRLQDGKNLEREEGDSRGGTKQRLVEIFVVPMGHSKKLRILRPHIPLEGPSDDDYLILALIFRSNRRPEKFY
jgi:hypothetical protein